MALCFSWGRGRWRDYRASATGYKLASARARPLAPDALRYPEPYPTGYRDPAGDGQALVERLHALLDGGLPLPLNVSTGNVDALRPAWEKAVQDLIHRS